MVEKKLYTCEICNTDYADKTDAKRCEENHKLLRDAKIVGVYKSYNSIPDGVPCKIRVEFPRLNKVIEYRV